MPVDPEGSEEDRNARVIETYRLMCVRDLRGAAFLRLLHLAHTEGLLVELMKAAENEFGRAESLRLAPECSIEHLPE